MLMHLKVLVPFQIFADKNGVSRIVAETGSGSFGLLPRRLDCVAALAPGILIYETEEKGEGYLAVDDGVLVKIGPTVSVSVRRATVRNRPRPVAGSGGAGVPDVLDEQEKGVRSAMARLETGFCAALRPFSMNDEPDRASTGEPTLAEQVGAKAGRKLKARGDTSHGVWFGLGMMGLIGWSVVVPTLLGAALGRWLDRRHSGEHSFSWTLALLAAGLVIGCWNAWHWVASQDRAMHEDQEGWMIEALSLLLAGARGDTRRHLLRRPVVDGPPGRFVRTAGALVLLQPAASYEHRLVWILPGLER